MRKTVASQRNRTSPRKQMRARAQEREVDVDAPLVPNTYPAEAASFGALGQQGQGVTGSSLFYGSV